MITYKQRFIDWLKRLVAFWDTYINEQLFPRTEYNILIYDVPGVPSSMMSLFYQYLTVPEGWLGTQGEYIWK